MSSRTSTVDRRIAKAQGFEVSRQQVADPDWQAIIAFYAALHWVGAAFEHQTGRQPPQNHQRANFIYGPGNSNTPGECYLPHDKWLDYKDLQTFSEIARYELANPVGQEEMQEIEAMLDALRNWAKAILGI